MTVAELIEILKTMPLHFPVFIHDEKVKPVTPIVDRCKDGIIIDYKMR